MEHNLHEGQAGFRVNRSCMDNVYTLNEIVQGRIKKHMLDVQKAYDTVWRDGLWLKLWDMGVKGRMWRVIKKMYEASRITVKLCKAGFWRMKKCILSFKMYRECMIRCGAMVCG